MPQNKFKVGKGVCTALERFRSRLVPTLGIELREDLLWNRRLVGGALGKSSCLREDGVFLGFRGSSGGLVVASGCGRSRRRMSVFVLVGARKAHLNGTWSRASGLASRSRPRPKVEWGAFACACTACATPPPRGRWTTPSASSRSELPRGDRRSFPRSTPSGGAGWSPIATIFSFRRTSGAARRTKGGWTS